MSTGFSKLMEPREPCPTHTEALGQGFMEALPSDQGPEPELGVIQVGQNIPGRWRLGAAESKGPGVRETFVVGTAHPAFFTDGMACSMEGTGGTTLFLELALGLSAGNPGSAHHVTA